MYKGCLNGKPMKLLIFKVFPKNLNSQGLQFCASLITRNKPLLLYFLFDQCNGGRMMRTEVRITIIFFMTLWTDFNASYIFSFPVDFCAALEAYYRSWFLTMKYN